MRLLSSLSSVRSAFISSRTLALRGAERNVNLSVVVGSHREARCNQSRRAEARVLSARVSRAVCPYYPRTSIVRERRATSL